MTTIPLGAESNKAAAAEILCELRSHFSPVGPQPQSPHQEIGTPVQAGASVAVLPFNMSPEPEQDYFCDGISEEIITRSRALQD
jgi:hypothetical protein